MSSSQNNELKGRVAIVTGGGTGIGLAIARRFRDEGAAVIICGRREEKLLEAVEKIGGGAGGLHAIRADVTRTEDIHRVVRFAEERAGRIDILVNNAGFMRFGTLEETGPAMWDEMMKTNAFAPWQVTKAVLPAMRRAGGGSIINISSISGHKALPGAGLYCTTKAALQMLSQVFAMELAPENIRVNVICPAAVEETELAHPIFGPGRVSEFYDVMRGLHPLGRNGKPQDVAEAALFLASDRSAWITGILLPVDGGRHLSTNRPPIKS